MLLLSLLLLPLIGAMVLALRPGLGGKFAAAWSVLPLAVIGLIIGSSHGGAAAEWSLDWMPDAGIELAFRADGTSLLFLFLTAVVTLFSIHSSLRFGIGDRVYFALVLVMQSMLFGVFTATSFIPFFLCWEMTLIPSYLLVRLWGSAKAPKAALRFFVVTLSGGVCMLLGFLALQLTVGTMDFVELGKLAAGREIAGAMGKALGGVSGTMALTIVAGMVFLGLAVKVPVVPFHAWLPDAYAEAPTPVTMLLTGLLSKMGVYGLVRVFLPVFPEVLPAMAPWLGGLAVATVVLGALAALAQKDLKRILAYSSVNHLGYCVMAVAAVGASTADREAVSSAVSGAILQAFNHGVIVCALFYGVAVLEQKSGGLRGLNDFGGLRAKMPVFCGLFGLALFASIGLPGLSGFVGEFLIFNGVFGLQPWAASVALVGLLLTAIFLLRIIRLVFCGPLKDAVSKYEDIGKHDRWIVVPVVAMIVVFGVWPQFLLHFMNGDTVRLLDLLCPIP